MKVLNEITIKNLKQNKKRTIVTILGIALSVALICAVTTFVSSFQQAMVDRTKITDGNYYIYMKNTTDKQTQDLIENNDKVEQFAKSQNIGYAYLENSKNEYKPYVFLEAFDETALNNRGVVLKEGRLPQNSNEIIIPDHVLTNGGQTWKIGDKITLQIGTRIEKNELGENDEFQEQVRTENETDGELNAQHQVKTQQLCKKLTQDDSYCNQEETIINEEQKEYTIVGIMERPSFENYTAPGYTCLTKLENIDQGKPIDVSILLKNPKDAYDFKEELKKHLIFDISNVDTNDQLLQFLGEFKSERTTNFLNLIAGVVIGIIMFTSIFVIRNSFNISLTEKTKELGILASIGATRKQIRKSILFEGVILAIISIPLGILIGVLAIGIVLAVVNMLLTSGGVPIIDHFNLHLVVEPIAIIVAVVTSFIMIILSAIKPAIRASRIPPIDAIRNTNDIKISAKKIKTSRITKKLFGIEGEIANKNFKRSKKKYRTTIFSIFLSIVLFLSMDSVVTNLFNVSSTEYKEMNYNLIVRAKNDDKEDTQKYFKQILELQQVVENTRMNAILKYDFVNIDKSYFTEEHLKNYIGEAGETGICVYSVGEQEYQKYIKKLGLSYDKIKDKAIIYDKKMKYEYEEGKDGAKRVEYRMSNLEKKDIINYNEQKYNEITGEFEKIGSGQIEVGAIVDTLPIGENLFYMSQYPIMIISDEKMESFNYDIQELVFDVDNVEDVEKAIIDIDKTNKDNISNLDEIYQTENRIVLIVSIFLYGFIIVISLIGITNVFNTITTNMSLRSKEFAVLKSIGMTEKQFKKMINYESLLYGLKALIFGLPVGLAISYWLYTETGNVFSSEYHFPFKAVGICVVFVFAIIFITMRYAVQKSKNQNTIEMIRKDNI